MARKDERDLKKEDVKSSFSLTGVLFDTVAIPGLGVRLGTDLDMGDVLYAPNAERDAALEANVANGFSIPGIAQVQWIPTFGVNRDIDSYMNKASDQVWRDIAVALKQRNLASQFEAPDVTIVIDAMDSIHIMLALGERIYNASAMSSDVNKYYRTALTEACGGDYDSWVANRANAVAAYIQWNKDLKDLGIPDTFRAFGLHREMTSRLYADSVSSKAQLYVPVPEYVWSYAVVDEAKGLTPVELFPDYNQRTLTWDRFYEITNGMINAIKTSADFETIAAALRSTYAERDVLGVPRLVLDRDIPAVPIYRDAGFLTSLCNATPYRINPDSARIVDSKQKYLYSRPEIIVGGLEGDTQFIPPHLFNTITDKPTAPEMVQYCRWHIDVEDNFDEDGKLYVRSCGTEIITNINFISPTPNFYKSTFGGVDVYNKVGVTPEAYTLGAEMVNSVDAIQIMVNVATWNSFRFFPIMWNRVTNTNAHTAIIPFTNWNFSFTYDAADVVGCHNAYLQAAFTESVGSSANTQPVAPEGEKK